MAQARFTWPDGKQCAAALTFDADGETVPLVTDRERGHERLTLISTGVYGPEVGVPRLVELLGQFDLKATFFIPGFTAELHPEMIELLTANSHEIGHHGYLHERPDTLSDEQEEAVLVRGLEALERLTGKRPVGYRSPAWELKPTSPALLKRYGFVYDSSLMGNDIPYSVATPEGNLVELPIQWILDDYAHYSMGSGGISSPEKVFEVFASEFAGYHRYNGCYVLTMHPFVSGRPSRVLMLERLIQYINQFDGVWWATLQEIADYCEQSGQLGVWTPPDLKTLAGR
ncbi:MAG TPA: polysaccharide deacetylase [Thermomicrobiaceae bacterium]|nr:polysaccharide deacetylase [Thermomicrobiaceae bacterium]